MNPDRMMRYREADRQTRELIDQCRWSSAIKSYQEELNEFPEQTVFIAYNLGVFYQQYVGNSDEARQYLEMCVAQSSHIKNFLPPSAFNEVVGNACENLMLLSLSYEEYDNWGAQLEVLQPKNEILRTQRAEVHSQRDRGLPWSDVLLWIANSYYDPNPRVDPGQHGRAATTFHLLLKHRQMLRLSREHYRASVVAFASLRLLICGNCGTKSVKKFGYADSHEIRFLIEDALPFLEEYLKTNSSDSKVQECLDTLQETLERMEADAQRPERLHFPTGGIEDEGSIDPRRIGCVALSIGIVLSLLAGIGLFMLRNNGGEVSGWPATVLSFLAIVSSFFLIGGFRLRFGDKERYNRWTRR